MLEPNLSMFAKKTITFKLSISNWVFEIESRWDTTSYIHHADLKLRFTGLCLPVLELKACTTTPNFLS